ncbi:hypothetical protein [Nocardioides aquiterrae]|uniref:Uncharacterized protein n=1 Tax=Nocardioides aquiterrae TaxID=203799 RepID=A0ABN1UKD4_9ACTN
MSGDREDPDVGSVGEEAAKLLGALSEWARDAAHDVDRHLATGADECTYCPICRTVHAVRGLSPEVRTQLATAATTFLQAAAGLMASAARDQQAPQGGVEHIDLDGLDDDADWPVETDPEESDR